MNLLVIRKSNSSPVSFGKLSDSDVLQKSPLNQQQLKEEYFSSENFQYIVDNVADMFGYAHGTVIASVEINDTQATWNDKNRNDIPEPDELAMQFTMNASMQAYQRVSKYGKNFMFYVALKYGYPIIFGIVAHEIGHLITSNALDTLETHIVNGRPALVRTRSVYSYWDELCADYLAGIVLAQANPPLDHTPYKTFLHSTKASSTHPDGLWRVNAVEKGYLFGKKHPHHVTTETMSQTESQKQLLRSFGFSFYQNEYLQTAAEVRHRHCYIPNEMTCPRNDFLAYV